MAKIMSGGRRQGRVNAGSWGGFNSVGIDIGSTTTQIVFSRLTLGPVEGKHKLDIVGREVTHLSEISLTPFDESYDIDEERLSRILASAYEEAGYKAGDIDTGAVIITGVAARRSNAEKIVGLFADQMGRFVCATAGPNYEAVLAAHGSGAFELSDRGLKTVMNVDVGGGTTKIAIARRGEIVDTAALYVGARHVVLDRNGVVLRIEEPAEVVAEATGVRLTLGEKLSEADQRKISAALADCLFEVIERRRPSELTERLMITPPLDYSGKIEAVLFSGGVSEYVYEYTAQDYGDLGRVLGAEIRERMKNLRAQVPEPVERIRATVIGESQYTLQVSGTTTLVSDPGLLPMRNLPVVAPRFAGSLLSMEAIEAEIRRAMEMHDAAEGGRFALAFSRSVINQPSYEMMKRLSGAVVSALDDAIEGGGAVVLVFEADIGMGMGRVIKEEYAPDCSLVSIDEIALHDFNFIDIGKPTVERGFIPVVIKSLVFPNKM
ncbi:MAG: ethanolamine ammonia-lyase reactivating factor EutA [Candidatus Bathyarchaeota archaeon]|nr:ethanolamine ammonia-lyase reactivating factor EutA [Candidatus Bathyarchaeota archaeon]